MVLAMNSQSPSDGAALVLDGADLDLLELVLGGAIDNAVTVESSARFLTDAENTPLAELSPASDDKYSATAVQPFHVGRTAQWDPQLRRPARDVRQSIGDGGNVLAIAITDFLTLSDIERIGAAIDDEKPRSVLWTVFVGRRPGGIDSSARGPALVRSAMQLAPPAAIPVVVPWGGEASPNLLSVDAVSSGAREFVRTVATGYGADGVLDVTAVRSNGDRRLILELDSAWHESAAKVYPPETIREIEHLPSATGDTHAGLVVLLTGLSGSGKSTIAHALAAELPTRLGRQSTLLDGDEVRQMLSAGLGFDRESRELNVKRIGYVAGLIAHHGGTAIAAPIAPFAAARDYVRAQAETNGKYLLVYVSTPLEVCEARDRKGLYAKARAGEISDFTGISSPYEVPHDADLTIDTSVTSVDDAVDSIVQVIAATND